jgi:hypothetical protein
MSLHVRDRSPERIGAIVRFLQRQKWVGVLFTAGKPDSSGVPVEGRVPGTFALELVHLANDERGPDIVFTFPWSSAKSPSGLPGSDYTEAPATGPLTGSAGNHGSMSPWSVRNTFIAWGANFKRGVTVRTPSSNVDLVPTLLALMNLESEMDPGRFDGRTLSEAFADGLTRNRCRSRFEPISSSPMTMTIAPPCSLPSSIGSATSTRAGAFADRAIGAHAATMANFRFNFQTATTLIVIASRAKQSGQERTGIFLQKGLDTTIAKQPVGFDAPGAMAGRGGRA